jgi:hypothetical protein
MCKDFKEKYPWIDSTCRKIGRWTYFYQSGKIERKESYQKIKNCDSEETRTSWWEYYSEQGQLLRKEEYRNNILWNSDIADYYFNKELAGKINVKNSIRDTLEIVQVDTTNLIRNGDFSLYFGPPEMQITDGQNQIEKQIPFWHSPDNHTPDYYNSLRRLKNVPENINSDSQDYYGYVGLILYHNPTATYTEFITGELKSPLEAEKTYCLKLVISLSQNSGFLADQFSLQFSKDNHSFEPIEPGTTDILFITLPSHVNRWDTLCAEYISTGDEKYITVGRFIKPDKIKVFRNSLVITSEGDFNQSAYYLIDSIQLIENHSGCRCETENSKEENRTL